MERCGLHFAVRTVDGFTVCRARLSFCHAGRVVGAEFLGRVAVTQDVAVHDAAELSVRG